MLGYPYLIDVPANQGARDLRSKQLEIERQADLSSVLNAQTSHRKFGGAILSDRVEDVSPLSDEI